MTTHAHDIDTTPSTTRGKRDDMSSIYAMSYPALEGECVKQGHADYCAAHGHATYTYDGVDQGWCPRCGVVTEGHTPEPTTTPAQTIEPAPTAHTMYVCTDCMLADVNGDTSGLSEERAMELWSTPGTTGAYVGDEDTDLDFGTMPCATCGTHLAGARHLYEYDI